MSKRGSAYTIPPWRHYCRIVSSRFPPINVFESVLDPGDLDIAFALESLTNDRLRDEAGDLERVPADERIAGPGSSTVMAPFTHVGVPSRFSDGSFGVLYAGESELTAVRETKFHTERFLSATSERACVVEKRLYVGRVAQPMLDIRSDRYRHLADPDLATYPQCQAFGLERRNAGDWGLLYPSARNSGGECIAAFRPRAVSVPRQSKHYQYVWDGTSVSNVLEIARVL